MVGHRPLKPRIGVRIPVPQLTTFSIRKPCRVDFMRDFMRRGFESLTLSVGGAEHISKTTEIISVVLITRAFI